MAEVGVEAERVDPGEELEVNPAGDQRLVERSEEDVAHACLHLPEDRAPVVEEQLSGEEEPGAGWERRQERSHRRHGHVTRACLDDRQKDARCLQLERFLV